MKEAKLIERWITKEVLPSIRNMDIICLIHMHKSQKLNHLKDQEGEEKNPKICHFETSKQALFLYGLDLVYGFTYVPLLL